MGKPEASGTNIKQNIITTLKLINYVEGSGH